MKHLGILLAAVIIAVTALTIVDANSNEPAMSNRSLTSTPSNLVTGASQSDPAVAEALQVSRVATATRHVLQDSKSVPTSIRSPDEEYLDHPAIVAMSRFYREDPAALVKEVSKVWPGLLEQDVAPLLDWAEVEPYLADRYRDTTIGSEGPARTEVLVGEVLGSSLEDYLSGVFGNTAVSRERADALEQGCREILEIAASAHSEMALEWDNVIQTKVRQGTYDRWPYVTLMDRRNHFLLGEGRLLSASCAAFAENRWVVGFSVYEGEFPAYDAARARWEAARDQSRTQIEQLVQGNW